MALNLPRSLHDRLTRLDRLSRPNVPPRYRDLALFVLVAALFGSGFVAIKTGLRELPPVLFASLRFDVGAAALLAYVALTRSRSTWLPRTRGDLLSVGAAGVLLVALNNGLLFLGQETTTPAMASVMYGLNPVLAPVFAWWLLGDRISRIGALGIGVALAGVILIVQPSPSALTDATALGQLLVLGAAGAVALGSVLLKRIDPRMASVPLTAWGMVVGAVLLHGVSLAAGESPASVAGIGPATAASVLAIGIPSTAVAYAVHFGLIDRAGPVRANLVAYVVPVFAALTGWLLLGTAVSTLTVVGFLIVVAGFGLVERGLIGRELRRLRNVLRPEYGAGSDRPSGPDPATAPAGEPEPEPDPTPCAAPPCDD
ncbi:MAG: DMT family transporter [Salinirussus sp.]